MFVRQREKEYQVYDPWGFPGLWMAQEELLALADHQPGCCIIMSAGRERCHGSRMSRELPCETVLRRGVEYHKAIRDLEAQEHSGGCRDDTRARRVKGLRSGTAS